LARALDSGAAVASNLSNSGGRHLHVIPDSASLIVALPSIQEERTRRLVMES
jgi:hypothetical protein